MCLQMWGPGQCHKFTWMRINSGLFPPCVLTQYYLYPVNAFWAALGLRPDLFIFKVFTQEAGPSITLNAKYTSGHTNVMLIYFHISSCAHISEVEGKIILGLMALQFHLIWLFCFSSHAFLLMSLMCCRRNSFSPHGRSKVTGFQHRTQPTASA